jgi:hypothetical protein
MIERSHWMMNDLDGFRRFGGWSSRMGVGVEVGIGVEVGRKKGRIGRKRRWW